MINDYEKYKTEKLYESLTIGFIEKVKEGQQKCSLFEIYDENCENCDGENCPYDIANNSGN